MKAEKLYQSTDIGGVRWNENYWLVVSVNGHMFAVPVGRYWPTVYVFENVWHEAQYSKDITIVNIHKCIKIWCSSFRSIDLLEYLQMLEI